MITTALSMAGSAIHAGGDALRQASKPSTTELTSIATANPVANTIAVPNLPTRSWLTFRNVCILAGYGCAITQTVKGYSENDDNRFWLGIGQIASITGTVFDAERATYYYNKTAEGVRQTALTLAKQAGVYKEEAEKSAEEIKGLRLTQDSIKKSVADLEKSDLTLDQKLTILKGLDEHLTTQVVEQQKILGQYRETLIQTPSETEKLKGMLTQINQSGEQLNTKTKNLVASLTATVTSLDQEEKEMNTLLTQTVETENTLLIHLEQERSYEAKNIKELTSSITTLDNKQQKMADLLAQMQEEVKKKEKLNAQGEALYQKILAAQKPQTPPTTSQGNTI